MPTLASPSPATTNPSSKWPRLDPVQHQKDIDMPNAVTRLPRLPPPFIEPDLLWISHSTRTLDQRVRPQICLAPLGVGWVVWRDAPTAGRLIFYVNYFGGNMPTFALNFSRPAGQIIAHTICFSVSVTTVPADPAEWLRQPRNIWPRDLQDRPVRVVLRRQQH